MQSRILAMIGLVAGMLLLGCEKATMGEHPSASSQKTISENEGQRSGTQKSKDQAESRTAHRENKELPAVEKMTSLRNYLEKRHYKWPDEKESDLPLIIKPEVLPVPDEIKGPFPENAPWRIEEKKPEKKSGSGFWPWS